VPFCPS